MIAYDLARKLKLKHIAYHSVFRVDHFKDVPHFASKLAIENAIREFNVPFTIILRRSGRWASQLLMSEILPRSPRLRLPPTDISAKLITSTVQRL
jgi:uncharacterized protein YbjT (DUF2867 family)